LPIPVVDAYDTAIRDASPALVGYYRMEETVTPLVDVALTADMETRAGAPTYNQTGPHTGWKAVSVDGVDDSMRAGGASTNNILPLYEGPGTVVVWAKTADSAQTHGENQWLTLASGTVEGGHAFEMRDLGSGRLHDLHYLNSALSGVDIQHDASEIDVWRFWAATAGTVAGMRLYMDEAGDVTLAGSDATTDQMGWECWGFGANQVETVFGQWVVSRIAVYKAELTETQLQAIYDSTVSGGITGTAAATQAADTATASGTFTNPTLTGTAAVTQAADTATASGTFVAPTFTGTAAPTQADDTSTASGTFTVAPVTGTGTPTQGDDTSTASGTFTNPTLTGSAAAVEEDDTSTASGTFTAPVFTGTAAPTQDAETSTGSGTFSLPSFTGTAAVTQADDTSTAGGTFVNPTLTGSAAAVEEDDTSTASGTFTSPTITGSAAPTQAADTSSASGTFTVASVTGSANPNQAADTSTASGTFVNPTITGTAAVTQEDQTSTASGTRTALTFWVSDPVAYTPASVAYTPLGPNDPPPW
jgi:hypothetical protein